MTGEPVPSLRETAIHWHIRLRDGDDAAWASFTVWLAADPRNAAAYDEIERLDEDLDSLLRHLATLTAAPAPPRRTKREHGRLLVVSGGLAAALVAGLFLASPWRSNEPYQVVTQPGEQRDIALADGTSIRLNGSTRIALTKGDSRTAQLLQGQALFRVLHDHNRPFSVRIGDTSIVDLGTVFDVSVSDRGLAIGVSEGSVLYSRNAERQMIESGHELVRSPDGKAQIRRLATDAIGAWRNRRLVYAATPLSQVAVDLSRLLGVAITVEPAIADRPFSGSLVMPTDAEAARRKLQVALDVDLSSASGRWSMKQSSGSQ